MKKWNVRFGITIQAETRAEAWAIADKISNKHLRGLACVLGITNSPIPYPNEWIAINEPIKAQR